MDTRQRTMPVTRVAIVADIHGNLPALEAVVREIEGRGPFDRVLCGGDIPSNGLFPAECLQQVIDRGWECVRGNTDEWLVAAATDGAIAVHECPPEMMHGSELQDCDRWSAARLDPEQVDFLANLPLSLTIWGPSGQNLMLVHATPWSAHPVVTAEASVDTKRRLLDRAGADALVYGHIHQAYQERIDGKLLACAGSVGMPFDGDPRACFVIASDDGDGWGVEFIRVAYDNAAYARDLDRSDVPRRATIAPVIRAGAW
jgi:predicted phosphodiesterase